MSVREATVSDYAAVMELLSHLNSDDSSTDARESFDTFKSILDSPHFLLLVVEHEGCVVGTGYLNIVPNLTRSLSPYALIENVVTHPSLRHKGLGKKLMQAAITCAFDEGCYKVMLLTGGDEGVQTFYRQCGMDGSSKQAFIVRNDGK